MMKNVVLSGHSDDLLLNSIILPDFSTFNWSKFLVKGHLKSFTIDIVQQFLSSLQLPRHRFYLTFVQPNFAVLS